MKLLRIYPTSINRRFVDEAVDDIRNGNTVIFPTDSLYALGCDALSPKAIDTLCRIKGIDVRKDQLSILCADISMASEYARIDNKAFRYLREYLPGPFTFILPAAQTLPKAFKGRRTVGVRVSSNPIAEAICRTLGTPIMVSSAIGSADNPDDAGEPESLALDYASSVGLMIDGGSITPRPSAIIDLCDSSNPVVVRDGPIEFVP